MATSKQDRQGARTIPDLERKYKFGENFAKVIGISTKAQQAAEKAAAGVVGLDKKLDHTEIFNRLTNNGQMQGIYKGGDGQIYINATYIVSGIIKSPDGTSLVIDLENGNADLTGTIKTLTEMVDGNEVYAKMRPSGFTAVSVNGGLVSALTHEGVVLSGQASLVKLTAKDGEVALLMAEDGIGAFTAGLSNGRVYLTGLTAPVDGADAVNKAYVDALEARIAALEAAINS